MGYTFFLFFLFYMKILSCIFVLAVLSSPLFGTEYLHADTVAAMTADDSDDADYIKVLFDAWNAGTVADLVEADFVTATNLSAAVLLAIVTGDPGNTATTVQGTLDALDDAITNVETCFAAIADTDCLCGTEGASDLNDYSADDDSCDDEVTEADVILINKWLDAAKLPGFLNADLTALSTGAWTTVSCYADAEEVTLGTGFTGCANEYGLLRALWDDATVPAATLTAGGLTATNIPGLLFAYESNANSDIWDGFATYFVDGEEFADGTFELEDLQDVFCADGVPADAADVVTNAADFGGDGLPFDALFLEAFLDEVEGWDSDEGELTADADLSNYNWLTAICPGDGSGAADIVDLWGELFADLVAYGDEGMFTLVADCNPDFVDGTPSTTIDHTAFDVACLPCPVAGADGVVV